MHIIFNLICWLYVNTWKGFKVRNNHLLQSVFGFCNNLDAGFMVPKLKKEQKNTIKKGGQYNSKAKSKRNTSSRPPLTILTQKPNARDKKRAFMEDYVMLISFGPKNDYQRRI